MGKNNNNRISLPAFQVRKLCRHKSLIISYHNRSVLTILKNPTVKNCRAIFQVERKTRFALATPSLARRCSTTELFPHLVASASATNISIMHWRRFVNTFFAIFLVFYKAARQQKRRSALHNVYWTISCGRWDLNPYGISPTTPSKWRVCRSTTTASLGNNLEYKNGAVERIWTSTGLPPLAPEASASAVPPLPHFYSAVTS